MTNRICGALLVAAGLLGYAYAGDEAPQQPAPAAQTIKLNFKDTPLETVLEQLSEMTGLAVIKDMTVEGRISVISKQAMNVSEAIALLNSVLKEKGYIGIRTGKILKIVKLDEAKKQNIPVRTGCDASKIEPSDEIITQVIPIRYIDAVQLKKDFATLIPSFADLEANAGSNTLILTDTCANVRRIVEMVQAMDTQSTAVAQVKVFQLKFANATSAAKLISDLFKDDTTTQQQGNVPPFLRNAPFFNQGGGGRGPGPQPAAAAPADDQSHRLRKVTASADDRTNSVVVSASPDTMEIVAQIIKDLDSNPAEEQGVFIFHCMNAQATNIEAVMNTLFATDSNTNISRSNNTQRPSTGIGQNVARSPSSGALPGNFASATNSTPQGFNQGNRNAPSGTRPQALAGDLTGQVFVVADVDTNSLIVLTGSKNFDRVRVILKDLDRPVPQVLIKVLIAEVTHDKNTDVGVDTSILTKGAVQSSITDFGLGSATGGLITKVVADHQDISATLRALETVGKVDVLSRPYILASDNQLSSITVGQEVPFVINSRTTDTGQTINTIQYQDIGIILNVTAHINDEGLVIMDVAPEVSDLTGQTVPISAGVTAPVFSKRSAQSRVGIKDGQTVVIGGMMEDKKTENEQGVPVLRRIPGLGQLFRRTQRDKSKTELLIFLTPHVAHIPDVLKCMTEDEKAGLKIVPKAVKPGTFEEHLRGMERGAVNTPENVAPRSELRSEPKAQQKPEDKAEVVKPEMP